MLRISPFSRGEVISDELGLDLKETQVSQLGKARQERFRRKTQ
jgi:hypothetical protein